MCFFSSCPCWILSVDLEFWTLAFSNLHIGWSHNSVYIGWMGFKVCHLLYMYVFLFFIGWSNMWDRPRLVCLDLLSNFHMWDRHCWVCLISFALDWLVQYVRSPLFGLSGIFYFSLAGPIYEIALVWLWGQRVWHGIYVSIRAWCIVMITIVTELGWAQQTYTVFALPLS